jgi:AraC-like DNA-binding protein
MSLAQLTRGRSRRQTQQDGTNIRDRIRELYEQNLTDEAIANRLDMHRSNVTRIRNELGLLPRWGGRNGHVFTDRIDADLVDLKANTKLTWSQISLCLNFPVPVLHARHELLLTRASQRCDSRRPEQVRCLQCKQFFTTPNRRQIHYCDPCKKRIDAMGSQYYDY